MSAPQTPRSPAASGESVPAGCDLHLDCPSGLAGDMFLGACLDLGMPLAVLEETVERLRLERIGLDAVSVEARETRRGGMAGTRFRVLRHGEPVEGPDPEEAEAGSPDPSDEDAHGRTLAEIRDLIETSDLAAPVRERSLGLFGRLGAAEAQAHGVAVDEVHFHEVGAVDSIVDLVGAAAAIEHLAPRRVTCGPVNVGGGTVRTEHGRLPVPPPAAAALLAEAGVPVYGSAAGELLTPTGAVLLAELVDGFGPLPPLRLIATGHGHGRRELPGWPNTVRILIGRPAESAEVEAAAWVTVIETEIDNLPGEGFGHLMERLLAAGALDVYFTPVQMKKSRPGTLVTLLCRPERRDELAHRLLAESGSLGCRFHDVERLEAEREVRTVTTRWGEVRVKSSRLAGRRLAEAPEFEDCRRLAEAAGVAWREVHAAALAAIAASRGEEEP